MSSINADAMFQVLVKYVDDHETRWKAAHALACGESFLYGMLRRTRHIPEGVANTLGYRREVRFFPKEDTHGK